jgi:hypothetical protein
MNGIESFTVLRFINATPTAELEPLVEGAAQEDEVRC